MPDVSALSAFLPSDILSAAKVLGILPLNSKKFPKLSYSKSSDSFTLFYNGPDADFGQQSFSFSYDDFIYAFQNSKFKHDTPKNSYSNFFDLFFSKTPNPILFLSFFAFSITPTLLKKLSLSKSYVAKKRKVSLSLKPSALPIISAFIASV